MKTTAVSIFLLSFLSLFGQKKGVITISDNAIKTITIKGDAIFKIQINTTINETIKLISTIDGEYASGTIVQTEINNENLLITTDYKSLTEKADDKLSAHKVESIEFTLIIPEYLSVYFKSNIASAIVKGTFKMLTLELSQGNAFVKAFNGNAVINTLNGNVFLKTENAKITANSKTGKILSETILGSKNKIRIQTINGNINITKTKK